MDRWLRGRRRRRSFPCGLASTISSSPTEVKRFSIEYLSLIAGHWTRYVYLTYFIYFLPSFLASFLSFFHLYTRGTYRSGPSLVISPQLHTAGARNFLLLNVPPIHRGPNQPNDSSLPKSIPSWNARLAALATIFGSMNPETSVFLYDTYGLFNKILDGPEDFEQTRHLGNLRDQCDKYVKKLASQEMYERECGLPYDQYFWRDGLHVTFPVHRVLAERVAGLLRGWQSR